MQRSVGRRACLGAEQKALQASLSCLWYRRGRHVRNRRGKECVGLAAARSAAAARQGVQRSAGAAARTGRVPRFGSARRACGQGALPYPNPALPQAGAPLGPLLVLERLERVGLVRLSRKASLLGAAGGLPRALADIAPGLVAPGYVASVTPDAVFVRFLGGLTGRAGAARAAPPRACAPRAPRPASNPVTGRW